MLSNTEIKTRVDDALATITHIGYSEDGANELAPATYLPRTPVVATLGGWTTPAAGDPYAPANASAGESGANAGATVNPGFWAGFTALTGGTRVTEWIPNMTKGPFPITASSSGNTITAIGASAVADTDMVRFFGPTLPTGLTAGTLYYVKTGSVATANGVTTFQVATVSNGGTVVALTGAGSGVVCAVQTVQVVNGGKLSHAAGALVPAKAIR